MTKTPTHDQKFNVLKPGPALLADRRRPATRVRDAQARLKQIAWLFGDVTGTYDAKTVAAVKGFQAKRAIPVTGEIDQRTMDRLTSMTRTPTDGEKHNKAPSTGSGTNAPLDPRCATGRALCVDKSSSTVRWVVDGKVKATYAARFGSDELPTREGAFSVLRKSRDHVSTLYHTSMPLRDVLQRRPGGALLARLRGQRLRRQQPRVRERARLQRHGVAVRPGERGRQGHRLLELTSGIGGREAAAYAFAS